MRLLRLLLAALLGTAMAGCVFLMSFGDLSGGGVDSGSPKPDGQAEGGFDVLARDVSPDVVGEPDALDASDAPETPVCIDASFQSDPVNCGRCGHDCGGGLCEAGICEAVTIASAQSHPVGIAVDTTNLYWTLEPVEAGVPGAVMQCAVNGCTTPKPLVPNVPNPLYVAADSVSVFWSDFGTTIQACSTSGCGAPTTPAASQTQTVGIAVDNANLYWTNWTAAGTVSACQKASCNPTPIAGNLASPEAIALDVANVYWTNSGTGGGDGTIVTCPKPPAGCASPRTIASGELRPWGVAVSGSSVFWTNLDPVGSVVSCPIMGCTTPVTLASAQAQPTFIVADAANVYWTNNGDGTVMSCATSGCSGLPQAFASGQPGPFSIAMDATSVYWVNEGTPPDYVDGSIWKRAKP